MSRLTYDFHNHSCLSPCADNDATPSAIAGMGALAGYQVMALTDHNSCKNCPAFFRAAEAYGVVPIAGMELTTAEEIHVVCLFETLDDALRFDSIVEERRLMIRNKPETFGEQLIVDENDTVIGAEPHLLIVATDIPLDEVPELVDRCGGICYPAHIDRDAGGILAILGDFPPDAPFRIAELHDLTNAEPYRERYPMLASVSFLSSEDAHRLDGIRDAEAYLELEADTEDAAAVRAAVFKVLREGEF